MTRKRVRIMPWAFFGVGAVTGSAVAGISIRLLTAAQPGDRLNFLGALLGAMITVVGSVLAVRLVEVGKEQRERRDRRALLYELLGEILETIEQVRTPRADERFTVLAMQRSAIGTLDHEIRVIQQALQWITPDSAAMVRAFGFIGELRVNPTWTQRPGLGAGGYPELGTELAPLAAMARAAMQELRR